MADRLSNNSASLRSHCAIFPVKLKLKCTKAKAKLTIHLNALNMQVATIYKGNLYKEQYKPMLTMMGSAIH